MCGIMCIIRSDYKFSKLDADLQKFLNNRGPDSCNELLIFEDHLLFGGFVLWQQGDYPTSQPIVTEKYILLFNGDIFNANKEHTISDTSWLIKQLNGCENDTDLIEVFKYIQGPYSIICYNRVTQTLYFGRDSLGRNSLLLEKNDEDIRILSSSCCTKSNAVTIEIPPTGIFKLNITSSEKLVLYPWADIINVEQKNCLNIIENVFKFEVILSISINPDWLILSDRKAEYNFSDVISSIHSKTDNIFSKLLEIDVVKRNVTKILDFMNESVKDRVQNTPKYCFNCIQEVMKNKQAEITCNHARIGILFSGGIDCTLLAAIADNYIPIGTPIDLINVAFQDIRNKNLNEDIINWDVPDRLSSKASYEELRFLFPKRVWNLVEINVTRKELEAELTNHIKHLIYPLKTVLDESLGCAFWFAARGIGQLNTEFYQSPSRVILLGSGADELFGGYTRHRNAFNRCKGNDEEKIEALRKELNIDWERIPLRNFGRDDRVIADHGKTARSPFVQEDLVKFLRSLHPQEKVCFGLDPGIGDKLLLRLCAFTLGFESASNLKKRAIQFGSRIANKNQNAKDVSTSLVSENFLQLDIK